MAWLGIWRDAHGDAIEIVDTRSCRTAKRHRLEGLAARIYLACDAAIVDALIEDKLVARFGTRVLALAVDATAARPAETTNPGGSIDWDAVGHTAAS